jgi:nucleotide-binding universal stress UspA family protein
MFKNILLLVDERPETAGAKALALKAARLCDARVFAVSVLPATAGPALKAARLRRSPGRVGAASEPEETAWARLYEIEDEAFAEDTRISLLLETGNRDDTLLALIDSYHLDALFIGARSVRGWEALIERCPSTVILVR